MLGALLTNLSFLTVLDPHTIMRGTNYFPNLRVRNVKLKVINDPAEITPLVGGTVWIQTLVGQSSKPPLLECMNGFLGRQEASCVG